jgi:hypothetical protein
VLCAILAFTLQKSHARLLMPDNQIYSFDSEYTKEGLIVLEVGNSD